MKHLLLILLLMPAISSANGIKPDFYTYATLDLIPEWAVQRQFGINPDIGTVSTPEDVWPVGGVYVFPTTSAATTIVSASASDATGGVGCQKAVVNGLDSDYIEIAEQISLTGQSVATLANEYFRINTASCILSGSEEDNAGDIDIKHGATILARLPAGKSRTQQLIFTTPANKQWLIDTIFLSLQKKGTGTAEIEFQLQVFGTNTWQTILPLGLSAAGSSNTVITPGARRYFAVPAKTDIRVRIIEVDTNSNQVAVNVAGFAVDTNYGPL